MVVLPQLKLRLNKVTQVVQVEEATVTHNQQVVQVLNQHNQENQVTMDLEIQVVLILHQTQLIQAVVAEVQVQPAVNQTQLQ